MGLQNLPAVGSAGQLHRCRQTSGAVRRPGRNVWSGEALVTVRAAVERTRSIPLTWSSETAADNPFNCL